MIALIDANNFFVSCEQALNPRLVGRPVVVLSNNDGCVISRSYEAKELGIPMGAPFFKYRDLMAKHNVVTYSVNFDLYQQFSTKIVSVLREVCPRVQVYSIDESFVELPNLSNEEVFKWCVDLRRKIFLKTCIPVSIGVSSSKTLTKIASYTAKDMARNKKGSGVFIINHSNREQILQDTYIGSVWGIGARLANRMRQNGIKTTYDLTKRGDQWIRSNYGIVGIRIKYELEGVSSSTIEDEGISRKGISSTKSFGANVYSRSDLYASLVKHIQTATRKLRRQNSVAGELSIFIRTGKHKSGSQYHGKTSRELLVPTSNTLHFNSLINEMLDEIYKEDITYYRSGVFISKIESAENYQNQTQLFDTFQHNQRVCKIIDDMQLRYGENIIRPACIPYKPKWAAKSQFKSFTQDIRQINTLPTISVI